MNPAKRGGFHLQTEGLEQQEAPNSHKSRFVNRAGTLHSVTHSSSWHWSNPKCSYSTQCSTHSTCHIDVGGRRGHTARKQQSCIKLRGTQLYKFSSAQHPRVRYSPRRAESTVHSQSCFPARQHTPARWAFRAQYSHQSEGAHLCLPALP